MTAPDLVAGAAALPVVFNGRFLGARQTGVQRTAHQLVRAVDDLMRDAPAGGDWRVAAPPKAPRPDYARLKVDGVGRLGGQLWEQVELPAHARGALLVNLCNIAPLAASPMVVMIHDAQVFTTPGSYSKAFVAWYRFALPRIARRAKLVLTVSDFSRRQLADLGVAPIGKIRVVPNGVDHFLNGTSDPSILDRHGLEPGGYVVSLASTQAHKNLKVLLEAMAQARGLGLKLVLIGATPPDEVARLGALVSDDVVFAGRVSDAEMRGLLEGALAYACPSTTEGFGLPPLEAMSLGTPAVAAPCGALPEVCGEGALYAAPDDPAAWVAAFEALSEPAKREALSARAKTQAGAFTWRRSGEALLSALVEAGGL